MFAFSISSQFQYDFGSFAFAFAASAFSETALKPSPGGTISPFCEPHTVTSISHSSCRKSIEASDEIASTISSAGWPLRFIARRRSAMRLTTPVDVSLCTTTTAFNSRAVSSFKRCSSVSGDAPRRHVPGTYSTFRPSRSATCRHAMCENQPVSKIRMRSPGDSVFTSAASAAPVPDEGNTTTGPRVRKIPFSPSSTSRPRSANSGPR